MIYECKCGSLDMFIEEKGNNTGLYCSMCGKWQKWLSKDEVRAFKQSCNPKKKKHVEVNNSDKTINDRLHEFVNFLDSQIDKQLTREPLSAEDFISKCSYAHAYEKDKNALLNIIEGRDWNDKGE